MTGREARARRTGRLPPSAAVTALLLAVLTVASFLPLWKNGFVGLGDPVCITRNHQVLEGLGAPGVRWAFTTFPTGNWRPLTWLSHLADVTLFGTRPAAHHLASLAVHALTTALLFLVLRGMTGSRGRSAVVAALVVAAVRRAPFLAVRWLWYLGLLVPVIGIVQVADQGMADRYSCLPLVGIFLARAWGAPRQ